METATSIAYKDLREYIDAVDRLGELRRVEGADWDLEIGAITEVAARAAQPKVVLFDNIKGYPKGFRVIVNAVKKPGCRFRRCPSWRSRVTSCLRKARADRKGRSVNGPVTTPPVRATNRW